jgi:hypothetical protein
MKALLAAILFALVLVASGCGGTETTVVEGFENQPVEEIQERDDSLRTEVISVPLPDGRTVICVRMRARGSGAPRPDTLVLACDWDNAR